MHQHILDAARGQIPLMVDDIEMAQFVYYLSSHKKMRNMINILNSKGELLLGQFKDGGLERLYKLRDWLKARNYTPMIFDFDRHANLDYTETVITVAGLSKFILADLTGLLTISRQVFRNRLYGSHRLSLDV